MDALQTILGRRTSHVWRDAAVPDEVVVEALEAAQFAPCHKLTWPWRFVRVAEREREALFQLAIRLKCGGAPPSEAKLELIRRKVRFPAHLVVVTQVQVEDVERAREDYGAIACAIQNIGLAVHARGYGSKWSTGGLTRHEETYAMLGVEREREEIVGFVWIGVPEIGTPAVPRRPELSEVVRWSSKPEVS